MKNRITAIRGRIDGVSYVVFFNDCMNNRNSDTLGFYAGWTGTGVTKARRRLEPQKALQPRLHRDDEGDPVIEFDVNLKRSVSRRNFNDTLNW